MKVRETAEWAAIMWFEVPESGGQLAELYFNEELLQQLRVGTELYRLEYDTNGEISDLVPVDFDGRRVLQSEEQDDYHLPAWLTRDTLKGVANSKIGCTSCALIVNTVCGGIQEVCQPSLFNPLWWLRSAHPLVLLAVEVACGASQVICTYDAFAIFAPAIDPELYIFCEDIFCCDRSKCGWFGECYDEEDEKCCDDGNFLVPMDGCCPGDNLDFTCGEGPLGGDGVRPLLCYNPDAEQCCANDVIHPKSQCCPGQVRRSQGFGGIEGHSV